MKFREILGACASFVVFEQAGVDGELSLLGHELGA
jgi:hypothetical protein